MSNPIELRTNPARIQLRSSASGPGRIQGYAASYRTLSSDLGDFRETLAVGAFRNAIRRNDDVVQLWDHKSDKLLGRRSAGTLRLRDDDNGLWFACDLPDTSDGRDVATLIGRNDLNACSFSFVCDDDEWSTAKDPDTGETFNLRTVKDLHLYDTTVCAFPAYPVGTSAGIVRSVVPDSVMAEARSFSTRGKTGTLTRKELDLLNLRARAIQISIDMDS
jgi:uncharacterized protein